MQIAINARKHECGQNVRHAYAENALCMLWIETAVRLEYALDLAKNKANRPGKFEGARRKLHALRRAHKQFVFENLPEST